MATQTNNFTRSNVNSATLQITDPGRSSFNLGNKNNLTIPFGKIVPVSSKILLPTDTFSGSLKPNFHLEKIGTPSIGATRLDTHTFVVNFRRINNQMRQNLEKSQNFFPTFDPAVMINKYVGYLVDTSRPDLSVILSALMDELSNWLELCQRLCDLAVANTDAIIQQYKIQPQTYYQLDTLYFLNSYFKDLSNQLVASPYDPNDARVFYSFTFPALLKPFIGPSSLLDYLGYPCYKRYNKMTAFLDSDLYVISEILYNDQKNSVKFSLPFLKAIIYNTANITKNGDSYLFSKGTFQSIFSELPLRAYYAVWYDYLRNWHIEERSMILDPDNFNNELVVTQNPSFKLNWVNDIPLIARFLSFYLLRKRDYGTDFLTSIQTDDAFRHVYSPVFTYDNSGAAINVFGSGSSLTPNTVQKVGINGESFDFPADFLDLSDETTFNPLFQDLQTLRRSNMLERWLARNYYFPDTYVGRLQARFGVRPSDYEVLVSQYIGGSESFITGQELVANMSTSESVVGSRNLKADVSATDSFSGSVSDYSILISLVSTVPIVTYDVLSPSVTSCDFIDFPQPEYATDTRCEARVSDMLRGFQISNFIGYVPRYYQFRVSADESHGRYLTDYRIYNWLRDNYSMSQENFDFSLNPYSLRVNLPLDAFIGLKPWDDFAFGSCDVNLVVNRALPAAIEVI